MNTIRKVQLLHQKAHGQGMNVTADEMKEIRKYKVDSDDGNYATNPNLKAYVNAVDNGYRLSFYDWCQNNCKADRRRKGSSAGEMAANNRSNNIGIVCIGWLIWGIAVYWIFNESLSVGASAVIGAIVSLVFYNCARKWAGFTMILLPFIILAIKFGR